MSQIIQKSNWFEKKSPTNILSFWTVSRKLVIPIVTVLVLLALGLSLYDFSTTTQRENAEEVQDLTRIQSSVLTQIEGLQKLALAIATDMANNQEVQAAFAAGDREHLTEIALPTFNVVQNEFDVKQYQFLLPPATSFLRLHQLDKFGDDLTSIRATVIKANADRKAVSGPEIGRGGLGVRGVVPVNYQGNHIGVIDVGIDIGPSFLESIKQQYGVDVQIMLDGTAAQAATFQGSVTDLAGPNENLLFQAGTNPQPIYADAATYPSVMAGNSELSRVKIEGQNYTIISFPLKDFSGKIIGVLEIVSNRTEAVAEETRGLLITILASLAAITLGGFIIVQFINNTVRPIGKLTETAIAVAGGDLGRKAEVKSNDEIGALANTFNLMVAQLRESFSTLEARVAERTQSLELAAEVARSVSQVRELGPMLKDAAEIIRSQFDLYYVQVYLANPSQNALVLQSGTGVVGAELVSRNHSLPITTGSINGRAMLEKRSMVIANTTASSTFRPNPLLPDTRSEISVPLLIGEKVIGVLDLQSNKEEFLSQELLPAFEALAGQLTIAIQNANLLAETEQARAEMETQSRRLVRASWADYLDAIHKPEHTGYIFKENKITPLDSSEESAQFMEEGSALSAPITVAGESLGNLTVELDSQNQNAQNSELVNIIARQVAQQIESLRLLENAERYRNEAEQAARRATIEGWKQYMASRDAGNLRYLYDSKEVRPYNEDQPMDETTFNLPIKAHEEIVGKLAVLGIESQDSESLEFASSVVERLGAHIENLRLFEETKRGEIELDKRARQLAAVAEVSSVSSRELDIEKMLHSVVHLTQRQFGLYHAHIFIHDENTAELKIVACGYKEGDPHEGTDGTTAIPLAQEKSLVARAARARQAVIVNDVRNEEGWLPNPLLPDTVSELAVPLVIGDQILGVLDVQSDRINAFSEEDANIYTTLASQVSTALQNAKSFSKSQQQAERESMLNTISQKIQSATTVEAVLQIAARELGHALGAPLTIAQLGMKDHNN